MAKADRPARPIRPGLGSRVNGIRHDVVPRCTQPAQPTAAPRSSQQVWDNAEQQAGVAPGETDLSPIKASVDDSNSPFARVNLRCSFSRNRRNPVNGGGIMLHRKRPVSPVAAVQNCTTCSPLSVWARGRRWATLGTNRSAVAQASRNVRHDSRNRGRPASRLADPPGPPPRPRRLCASSRRITQVRAHVTRDARDEELHTEAEQRLYAVQTESVVVPASSGCCLPRVTPFVPLPKTPLSTTLSEAVPEVVGGTPTTHLR